MNNRLNNNRFFGLSGTGLGLIVFAISSLGLVVINSVLPMVDGSFKAELLAEADGAAVTLLMAIFAAVIAVNIFSYLLMVLLGVNAMNYAKDPCGVKARTGLAKFLIVVGAVSLLTTVPSIVSGASFREIFNLAFPAAIQLSFAATYLYEVRKLQG